MSIIKHSSRCRWVVPRQENAFQCHSSVEGDENTESLARKWKSAKISSVPKCWLSQEHHQEYGRAGEDMDGGSNSWHRWRERGLVGRLWVWGARVQQLIRGQYVSFLRAWPTRGQATSWIVSRSLVPVPPAKMMTTYRSVEIGLASWTLSCPALATLLVLAMFGGFHIFATKMEEVRNFPPVDASDVKN